MGREWATRIGRLDTSTDLLGLPYGYGDRFAYELVGAPAHGPGQDVKPILIGLSNTDAEGDGLDDSGARLSKQTG